MIAQNVIMSVLIGIVITGVIPFIGGIILLVTGKIKGTSFWAGVLAYIISMIGITIVAAVMAVPLLDMMQNKPLMFAAIQAVLTGVCMAISLGVCEGACMKNLTFNGALSCGLGFGIGYAVTAAIGFISMYVYFVMINNGQFDQTYSNLISQGLFTKEQVHEMKSQFTEFTFSDVIVQIVGSIALSAVLVACAVFIMRGKCTKNLIVGILASAIIISAGTIAIVIPNVIAQIAVPAAIGIFAIVFALKMKEKVVQEEAPAVQDSFLRSIENVKNNDDNGDNV